MKKIALFLLASALFLAASAQRNNTWNFKSVDDVKAYKKAVKRSTFPVDKKLFNADVSTFKKILKDNEQGRAIGSATVITLPNADGELEEFELVEASNFEPALQAMYPDIRSYSGKSLKDNSTLKLSVSLQGVQGMIIRTDKEDEYMEPYSEDETVYAVFRSKRKGNMPWTCNTVDKRLTQNINQLITGNDFTIARAGGNLKTMRLALSCNGEYANYFGAFETTADREARVLAAFNATLTRCNGILEKDMALHLNLIAATNQVIYYNPATDPYTTLASWNSQLQSTLTARIGEANYDIGHMFGASGGGGNAGCIGCVCNPGKGSGITSPADGIPQGDNFDIDYVIHELGHQLGANHTFSHSNEGTGVNKEVGSGITIMGYAGITAQDVAPHSIDIFHQASIAQIEANLNTKTCPTTQSITANNTAPVITPLTNYSIPRSTPFALTGSATDAEGDALTYCWEQNDNSTTIGTSSVASTTKTTGPNWLSFKPTVSPTRLFPQLATILAGRDITGPLAGGDAGANIEALSSVARTLNFRLTVRDNAPYSSTAPEVGQTAFADVVITVVNTPGAFAVTSPNTNVNWGAGTSQTVTWSVNGTTAAPISCANVKISLSTDGGQTFPVVLAASTPNDGSEVITLPNTLSSTARIKIEAIGNIFFDISNSNFAIATPPACPNPTGLANTSITTTGATLNWTAVAGATSYLVQYKLSTATTWTNATLTTPTATSVALTGLTSGATYNWQIQSTCTAGAGNFVAGPNFTTTVLSCASPLDNAQNGTRNATTTPVIPFNTDLRGLINPTGDNDYYRFVITQAGTITITLTTLPANYTLALWNSAGSRLVRSQNAGTANETITRTVTAGTYYVQVVGATNATINATNCYTLRVALGTAARPTATTNASFVQVGEVEIDEANPESRIFPNPVTNILKVSLAGLDGPSDVTLMNGNGGKITTNKNVEHSTEFNVANLPKGMYIVRIVNSNRTVQPIRVVKQ